MINLHQIHTTRQLPKDIHKHLMFHNNNYHWLWDVANSLIYYAPLNLPISIDGQSYVQFGNNEWDSPLMDISPELKLEIK